jgi:hypothetical protein
MRTPESPRASFSIITTRNGSQSLERPADPGGGLAGFDPPDPGGEMAGFETSPPAESAPGGPQDPPGGPQELSVPASASRTYRATVSRWMPNSRAIRRNDQPRA